MKPRVVLFAGVALLLAVALGVRISELAVPANDNGSEVYLPLCQRELPGQKPPEEPELSIRVEVDTSGGKNRLDYYISEGHGYYVETLQIELWYKRHPGMGPEESPLRFEHHLDDYVEAGKTMKACLEIVPAELDHISGDMGANKNWDARVLWHGRARAQNPDPLPEVVRMHKCD